MTEYPIYSIYEDELLELAVENGFDISEITQTEINKVINSMLTEVITKYHKQLKQDLTEQVKRHFKGKEIKAEKFIPKRKELPSWENI